jgi:NAD(P)-dependent dehydrogenase (short-subunit alcohol dehydrogenase family)
MQFGTNHLGHFALTGLLLPLLRRAYASRVVTVSSVVHRAGRIRLDDWEKAGNSRWFPYTQSKLANLLFTSELQRRAAAAGTDLLAVAAHPGAATNLSAGLATVYRMRAKLSDRLFAQPDHMGALPQLYAAVHCTRQRDARRGLKAGRDGRLADVVRLACGSQRSSNLTAREVLTCMGPGLLPRRGARSRSGWCMARFSRWIRRFIRVRVLAPIHRLPQRRQASG